jgi:hypothetical protein
MSKLPLSLRIRVQFIASLVVIDKLNSGGLAHVRGGLNVTCAFSDTVLLGLILEQVLERADESFFSTRLARFFGRFFTIRRGGRFLTVLLCQFRIVGRRGERQVEFSTVLASWLFLKFEFRTLVIFDLSKNKKKCEWLTRAGSMYDKN